MCAAFIIALSIIVWLYTCVALHNGGGFMTAIAVILTGFVTFFGSGWLLIINEPIYFLIVVASIVIGFIVQANSRDDGLVN